MRNTLILAIATVLLIASGFFAYKGLKERTPTSTAPTKTASPAKANDDDAISPEVRSLALAMLDRHASDQDVLAYMRQMRPLAKTPMDHAIVTQFGTFIDQSGAYNRFRYKAADDRRECGLLNFYKDELREPHVNCMQIVGNDIAAAKQASKQATQAIQDVMSELHQGPQ